MSDSSFAPSASGSARVTAASGAADGGAAFNAGAIPELEDSLERLESLARALEGQPEALLALLRRLEQLHRSIQDGPFRSSLPSDRNALFQLLSEMERSGGWPYIPRLQLRTFMDLLSHGAGAEELASGSPTSLAEPPPAGEGDHPPLAA